MTSRLPAHRARRGHIAHIDIDAPIRDLRIPAGVTDVLVLVHHGSAVVGREWLPAGGQDTVHAETLWAVALEYHEIVNERRARTLVRDALGAPVPAVAPSSLSVIVCTKDRAPQLRACLLSLLELNRAAQLLVVDNGSVDDATQRVCDELGVRCVVESKPGQTAARNCGIRETSGELIAFTDDDVTVSADWLDTIEEAFVDPLTMIATGYIGPRELEHHDQVQFEAHGGFEHHTNVRVFDASDAGVMAAASSAGAGANMVIRRELVERIGGFDEEFGAGTPTRTSDDKVFYYRTLEAGYRIQFDPARKVWHQHRADREALIRIMRDYGTGEFTWTTQMLRTRGDTAAIGIWRWWGRHFLGDLKRNLRGGPKGVSLDMTAAEIRGVLATRQALRSLSRSHQAGGAGPDGPWREHPEAATAGAATPTPPAEARVTRELPKLSVAIASHNRKDSLARVLHRLASQSLPAEHHEAIVVLDGCTDGSAAMIRALELPMRTHIVEQENQGVAVARNAGVALAAHPITVLLDDDIEPETGWLEAFGAAHAATADPTWLFGNHPPVVGDGWADQVMRAWWGDHLRHKAEPGHHWTMVDMVDGNSAVPTALFREFGGFDPAFARRRQDYELGFRYLAAGGRCGYCAEAKADHRPSLGVGTMLANARGEGAHDVALAIKHPASALQLPLGADDFTLHSGRKSRLLERLTDAQTIAIADRLERIGQRSRWTQFVGTLWAARYRAGARDALTSRGLGALPDRPARGRVVVPLRSDTAAAVFAAGVVRPEILAAGGIGAAELVFEHDGHALASAPAVIAGQQWSWDDITDRSAKAIGVAMGLERWPN